jgi:hypothetical protein
VVTWLASPFLALRFVVPFFLAWSNGSTNCAPAWVHDLSEGVAVFASPDEDGGHDDGDDYYSAPAVVCDGGHYAVCTSSGCSR